MNDAVKSSPGAKAAARPAGKAAAGGAVVLLLGATGDLAMRMLWPSLFFLHRDGYLPPGAKMLASARSEYERQSFIDLVKAAVEERAEGAAPTRAEWDAFAQHIVYRAADATDPKSLALLKDDIAPGADIVAYLATSPALYGAICRALGAAGLAGERTRVVLEKPIGRDLASSCATNAEVGEVFPEERVFRVDHYLGKETVQNLLALRFGNTLFEPLWSRFYVDHVQITIAETNGVGARWDYYDAYGALRDMVQNHLLQLLCLVAMEPPASLDPDSVRDEKVKVLRCLRPLNGREIETRTVRGQYAGGVADGGAAPGYIEEQGGHASATETFVALRVDIDNWRWSGTPFYVRTGKRLGGRRTQIVVTFKDLAHSVFHGEAARDLAPNRLVIRLQPEEEISLQLMNKQPGIGQDAMRLHALGLNLSLTDAYDKQRRRIAYERLLLDVLNNTTTLFVRRDEIEAAWTWIDGIAAGWAARKVEAKPYAAGSWGPAGAFALIERDGRTWFE